MSPGGDGPDERVVLTLPAELRGAFKEPFGPVHTDADRLVADLGDPVIAVGDVVTRHLEDADARPGLAVVDWVTEREELAREKRPDAAGYNVRLAVKNPAATLTAGLLDALRVGIERGEKTVVVVDGEEDLATLPVLAVAPVGASVVYGQPDEGMVHVRINDEIRTRACELLSRMAGEHDQLWSILDVEPTD